MEQQPISEGRIDSYLQDCTVRLRIKNSLGTGFFVAPRLILTCAHVVQYAWANELTVTVDWFKESREAEAEIVSCLEEPHLDLALLRLHEGLNWHHPCVTLDIAEPDIGAALYCYGYTQSYPQGDSATFTYEGISKQVQVIRYKLKGGQAEPGLSGGALLNQQTGKVCGVINLSRNINTDLGGRGIPVTVIAQQFPDLLAQNKAFYGQNKKVNNSNYLIYGKAVAPEGFWGRKEAIAHLKNRIGAKIAQPVNIVGYRRQGKSSVLRYIKDRPEIFFPAAQQPLIVPLDLQAGQFHSPEGVTEGIRRAIAGHLGEEFWTRAENTDLFAVEDGLEEVRHRGYRLILLLDEFERVQLKDFQDWGEDCRSKMSAGIFTYCRQKAHTKSKIMV